MSGDRRYAAVDSHDDDDELAELNVAALHSAGGAGVKKKKSTLQRSSSPAMPASSLGSYGVPGCNVIVIHPGSLNVRIGFASDPLPATKLNVVARRKRGAAASPAPMEETKSSEVAEAGRIDVLSMDVDDGGAKVPPRDAATSQTETDGKMSQGDDNPSHSADPEPDEPSAEEHVLQEMEKLTRKKQLDPGKLASMYSQAQSFNEASPPERIPPHEDQDYAEYIRLGNSPDAIVGDQALLIHPQEPYMLFWPFSASDLLSPAPKRSMAAIASDIACIWKWLIETQLKVSLRDLSQYRALVVVSDFFSTRALALLAGVLTDELGFHSFAFQQESTAATFGAGISTACVVDIGEDKTSVVCVDEGFALPDTSLMLQYGGRHIAALYKRLLSNLRCGFMSSLTFATEFEWSLVREWKQAHCHLTPQEETFPPMWVQTLDFVVRKPSSSTLAYKARVLDEMIKAPLGLFYPLAFRLGGASGAVVKRLQDEDILADFCFEVTKNNTSTSPLLGLGGIGLDEAVIHSIQRCPSTELRRKMQASILVIGGVANTPGLTNLLELRLASVLPAQFGGFVQVLANARNLSPELVCWKGATVAARLSSMEELWISSKEWEQYGVVALRRKAMFQW